jgi:V/A-type H+/Na+-transporting ATPase subunit I
MAEVAFPAQMSRIVVVATDARLRDALVAIADAGVFEPAGGLPAAEGEALEAFRRLERGGRRMAPRLADSPPDLAALERDRASDLLAGEVELDRHSRAVLRHRRFALQLGWAPTDELPELARRLAAVGASVVELPIPDGVEPPTLLRPGRVRSFRVLVETYGTARYRDVDPTPFAAASFVVMFGMMFGDVGHGLLLALLAALLRRAERPAFAQLRPLWAVGVACGLCAAVFGLLYGEAFGPTGIVPTLWVSPTDHALELLATGIGVGVFLLVLSYAVGILNRWREHGPRAALVAASGVAGLVVLLSGGALGAGVYAHIRALELAGGAGLAMGVGLLATGYLHEAGRGSTAVTEAVVEVFDAVLRVAANVVSFARLAAFGLTHAAIGAIVLDGSRALWGGPGGVVLAALVFLVGNSVAFALEALVAGVQALRLEYYELFSRIFAGEGHPFQPWRIARVSTEARS